MIQSKLKNIAVLKLIKITESLKFGKHKTKNIISSYELFVNSKDI